MRLDRNVLRPTPGDPLDVEQQRLCKVGKQQARFDWVCLWEILENATSIKQKLDDNLVNEKKSQRLVDNLTEDNPSQERNTRICYQNMDDNLADDNLSQKNNVLSKTQW